MINDFDGRALFAAMDARRAELGLTWSGVARAIWSQSAALNEQRQDHPISPATLTGIGKRGDCTCQHALFVLRWLGRSPESFLATPVERPKRAHPVIGDDRRLRWNLAAVYESLNERRQEQRLTWRELAAELRCTQNQLTGIRVARYAISMVLMMRIVCWLDVPSSTFIYAAKW